MYQYNQKRIIAFLVLGAAVVVFSVGAIRTAANYLSQAQPETAPTPTLLQTQPTRQLKPQAVSFPRELLGLCRGDSDYDFSYDVNQDGCIRQNDWDLFGR